MKITILTDNYVDSQKLKAEHGWSVLIEAGNEKILLDTGQSSLLLNNAKIRFKANHRDCFKPRPL